MDTGMQHAGQPLRPGVFIGWLGLDRGGLGCQRTHRWGCFWRAGRQHGAKRASRCEERGDSTGRDAACRRAMVAMTDGEKGGHEGHPDGQAVCARGPGQARLIGQWRARRRPSLRSQGMVRAVHGPSMDVHSTWGSR